MAADLSAATEAGGAAGIAADKDDVIVLDRSIVEGNVAEPAKDVPAFAAAKSAGPDVDGMANLTVTQSDTCTAEGAAPAGGRPPKL